VPTHQLVGRAALSSILGPSLALGQLVKVALYTLSSSTGHLLSAEELERHINGVSEHYFSLYLDDFQSTPLPLEHHSRKCLDGAIVALNFRGTCFLKLPPSFFAVAT
jgi:hypothetical protein